MMSEEEIDRLSEDLELGRNLGEARLKAIIALRAQAAEIAALSNAVEVWRMCHKYAAKSRDSYKAKLDALSAELKRAEDQCEQQARLRAQETQVLQAQIKTLLDPLTRAAALAQPVIVLKRPDDG